MKQVTLLRHGKSDWEHSSLRDFDRPLKARGQRDAVRMGEHLASLHLVPGLIVSSPAARARQTATLFAEALGYPEDIRWDERIYAANSIDLTAVLRELPDDADHVMLIGHNPGLEELVAELVAGRFGAVDGSVRLSTASVAHILLDLHSWADIHAGCGELEWIITPRDLDP
jgi:phosphohistidine phosphatase